MTNLPKAKMKFSVQKWLDQHYKIYSTPDYKASFPPVTLLAKYRWVIMCDGLEVEFNEGEYSKSTTAPTEYWNSRIFMNRNWCVPPEQFKPYEGPRPMSDAEVEDLYQSAGGDHRFNKYGDDYDLFDAAMDDAYPEAHIYKNKRNNRSGGIDVDPVDIYGEPSMRPKKGESNSVVDSFVEDVRDIYDGELPF